MCKKIITFILSVVMVSANAQTVGDMFMSMPDSLFPYLTQEQRVELVKLKQVDTSTSAVLRSVFNCSVSLDSLEAACMTVNIDSTMTVEMARLATVSGDSLYCLLQTVSAPERETVASIYNKVWEKVSDVDWTDVPLLNRPDTMSDKEFANRTSLIEFRMVEARLENADTIVLKLNVPMLSSEDKRLLQDILVQRRMRWDGEKYRIDTLQ
ncbi:MAG: DUF3256 family protein [Prevotella sp.]|nr:DUF3256 family protein [Prevotella sp.]